MATRKDTEAAPTGLAFFDFDKTLIADDIGPLYGWYLFRQEMARLGDGHGGEGEGRARRRARKAGYIARYTAFLSWMGLASGLYKARALRRSQIVRGAYKGLKGLPVEEYLASMDPFLDDRLEGLVYPEMVEEIRDHQAAGRTCIIITTGQQKLVERCLEAFPPGIELIGCHLEEQDGKLTGRVDGPLYGADKANILRTYAKAHGIDLADCWAYSDHYSDYHMLEAVGHAVCVNPRGRLLKMAQERGWRIMEPRDPQPTAVSS
ncbi:MAG: HAD family hydrolase [Thermoplasmatota archaeon]